MYNSERGFDMEDKCTGKAPHRIVVEDRHSIHISGVGEVESFDEQTVSLYTEMGMLNLKGTGLHINTFNVNNGELSVEGELEALFYTHDGGRKAGFLSRLFK